MCVIDILWNFIKITCMKGFYLTKEQLADLHSAHQCERNKRFAYLIHAAILLGTGYTVRH